VEHRHVYVINFFVSILPATVLMNWIYYKNNRSITAAILFHFMLNLFLSAVPDGTIYQMHHHDYSAGDLGCDHPKEQDFFLRPPGSTINICALHTVNALPLVSPRIGEFDTLRYYTHHKEPL